MCRRFVTAVMLTVVALGVFAVLPAVAQNGAVWNAEYYNTSTLSGGPVLKRQESALAFNWGAGSPDSKVHNDNFSARYGTDVSLPAGNYRFWAQADDQVRIIVDFVSWNPVINTWGQSKANQLVSGDVSLGAGTHHIQVDYSELSGDARLYVTWANLATNPSGPNFPALPPQPVPVSVGAWTAQYFGNNSLSGSPTAIISETTVSHDWGSSAPLSSLPKDNFSVRWTSVQNLPGGNYQLSVQADDGVRVYVNGQRLIDQWHGASGATYTADISLPAGQHNFMVEYYEATGKAFIHFDLLQSSGVQPPVVVPPQQPVVNLPGVWLASYYNNTTLSGSPTAILSESSPSHNWGNGSPVASVLADNFSARWTSAQVLAGGTYQLQVSADDGVRVYIDNVLYIDEWHPARAETYSRPVTLAAGTHNFTVEYYEASGVAFLNFSFGGTGSVAVVPTPVSSAASGTLRVGAYRLNVRTQPTTSSAVLTKINSGEIYSVVGCNADRSWWQINVGGSAGWVYGNYVDASGATCTSATNPSSPSSVPTTGYLATAVATVNVRGLPSTSGALLGTLRAGQSVPVVGRNAGGTWWRIDRDGLVGWVSAAFAHIQYGADLSQIPVQG